jgi:hypothetical protein
MRIDVPGPDVPLDVKRVTKLSETYAYATTRDKYRDIFARTLSRSPVVR